VSSYVVGKIGQRMKCLGKEVVEVTSTELPTYAVRVFREGDLWVIEVPELDAVSQSRTLAAAAEEARALVAVWLDVPADQVAVHTGP
jgi:hypothetical protein